MATVLLQISGCVQRTLKISQRLPKLSTNNIVDLFFDSQCVYGCVHVRLPYDVMINKCTVLCS